MRLSDMSEEFVISRAHALEQESDARNDRFDEMEKLYRLDVWTDDKPDEQRRVTSPRPWNVVEATRALLFTRRPVIEVPASVVRSVADEAASRMERYLYGAWSEMGMSHVVDDTEFNATALGLGVLRIVYDPNCPAGEFPLVAQAINPRGFFNHPDPRRPLQDSEVVIWTERPRRDIEAEWGKLPTDTGAMGADRELWLDGEVWTFDYWGYVLEPEEEAAGEAEEEALGVVGRFMRSLGRALAPPEEEAETGREGEAERTKMVRKVVNCVVAEGRFVKKPMIAPGYETLPFFRWAGVRTPLEGKDAHLSVLYGAAGGARENGAQGTIATLNELLSRRLEMVNRHANAAVIINDPSLAQLNSAPGYVNVTNNENLKVEWVVPPGDNPDTVQLMKDVADEFQDATIPDTMMGRYQAAASGVALQMVTNPVLMRVASRQREREDVLQRANGLILALTEEYAPLEGWTVWGRGRDEQMFEERLEPAAIHGYRRNMVHLSARLPRDVPQETMTLGQLATQKILSRHTVRERVQTILDLPNQSPEDEMLRLMIEDITLENEDARKMMAQEALAEYDQSLAAKLAAQRPPAPPGAGPPPGPGQGPMQGVPPNVVPVQQVPPMLGPQQQLNMAGQGLPPGAPTGRPPAPPAVRRPAVPGRRP